MSCGATAGLALEEIFAISREAAESFADVLVAQPEARTIVVNVKSGARHVDVVPIGSAGKRRG
jgi:hypothetical protein